MNAGSLDQFTETLNEAGVIVGVVKSIPVLFLL